MYLLLTHLVLPKQSYPGTFWYGQSNVEAECLLLASFSSNCALSKFSANSSGFISITCSWIPRTNSWLLHTHIQAHVTRPTTFRIIDQVRKESWKVTWGKRGPDEITWHRILPHLQNLHPWGLCHILGDVVPVIDFSHCKKIPPYTRME